MWLMSFTDVSAESVCTQTELPLVCVDLIPGNELEPSSPEAILSLTDATCFKRESLLIPALMVLNSLTSFSLPPREIPDPLEKYPVA